MPTIPVPAPPPSAFNKNRPISDLLQHQVQHFRHIEARLPTELHSNMTARDLQTENGAAQYIAHITEALRSLHGLPAIVPIRRPTRARRPGIAIAAAGDATSAPTASAGRKRKAAAGAKLAKGAQGGSGQGALQPGAERSEITISGAPRSRGGLAKFPGEWAAGEKTQIPFGNDNKEGGTNIGADLDQELPGTEGAGARGSAAKGSGTKRSGSKKSGTRRPQP